MNKTRYECSWCREIVGMSGDAQPPAKACTGQPQHTAHEWTKKDKNLRSRLPFENERRLAPVAR